MPRIFDNIEQQFLPALADTIKVSERADFCIGYFNLRGWKQLDSYIEQWHGGEVHCCRILVGMQRLFHEEMHDAMSVFKNKLAIDNSTASRLRKKLAEEFRNQLTLGIPTNEDEIGLRRLVSQIKSKKVTVKLFLQYPLHAKLYLFFRSDTINPIVGYLGSSNLTVAGLIKQGELNIDVLDYDACIKLSKWFEDRWNDRWCIDISDDLVKIIEESWARRELIPPYHIYINMAYHLSQEARAGLSEFRVPRDFEQKLLEFQIATVKIAARHLNKRGGVLIEDGSRFYFPTRLPKTIRFNINEQDPTDQYARLYADDVVEIINTLNLPRYGLGNYAESMPQQIPTQEETEILQDLSRGGQRLQGFCRTNLFKRLESSGMAFLQSIERHILRNYIFLYAIENNKPIVIGTQTAELLDARINDSDEDISASIENFDNDANNSDNTFTMASKPSSEDDFKRYAAEIYEKYFSQYKSRFKWLRSSLFSKRLSKDLYTDSQALLGILTTCGEWDTTKDAKLNSLFNLLTKNYPSEKVIVFTQFADTVKYLESQLKQQGVLKLAGVTGDSTDSTATAWRFSPVSNNKQEHIKHEDELRILIATDVLSEGQNLQDCCIIVNYALPWAIIRLVQRAGRVDRIGQHAENILCYSFLPAEGVERIIRLRDRVRSRLNENAEILGTDETFFEDDRDNQTVLDLYNEKSGILDGDADTEVDLTSYAYQIWKNAINANPVLQKIIPSLPPLVYSTKSYVPTDKEPAGALVYVRTAEGNDSLAWVDTKGNSVTESQLKILKAAECLQDTPALPHSEKHHLIVRKGVEFIIEEEKHIGGQLGCPSSAWFRTYERLKRYVEQVKGTLFETSELLKAVDDIYNYPLRQSAIDILNRQLRSGISDESLADLVVALREDERLCEVDEEKQVQEPRIICSMGLVKI